MELINRDDVIDAWRERVPKGDREDFLRVIRGLPTVDLVFCKDCVHVTRRENLEEPMKSRLPKELIGECRKTKLYVHADDYCCGGEE